MRETYAGVKLSEELEKLEQEGRVRITKGGNVHVDGRGTAVQYRGVWMTVEERRELFTDDDRRAFKTLMIVGTSIALLAILTPPWPWPFA